jgi:hypothetical protein
MDYFVNIKGVSKVGKTTFVNTVKEFAIDNDMTFETNDGNLTLVFIENYPEPHRPTIHLLDARTHTTRDSDPYTLYTFGDLVRENGYYPFPEIDARDPNDVLLALKRIIKTLTKTRIAEGLTGYENIELVDPHKYRKANLLKVLREKDQKNPDSNEVAELFARYEMSYEPDYDWMKTN